LNKGVGLSIGQWLENNFSGNVRNREETLFWKDRWLEGDTLCIRFDRLIELAIDKNRLNYIFGPLRLF
jgi:hypothetical protein